MHCLEEASCREDKRMEEWKRWEGRRFCKTKQMLESWLCGRVESISEGFKPLEGGEGSGYLFCQASAHCAELERSQEQEIDSVKAVHRPAAPLTHQSQFGQDKPFLIDCAPLPL